MKSITAGPLRGPCSCLLTAGGRWVEGVAAYALRSGVYTTQKGSSRSRAALGPSLRRRTHGDAPQSAVSCFFCLNKASWFLVPSKCLNFQEIFKGESAKICGVFLRKSGPICHLRSLPWSALWIKFSPSPDRWRTHCIGVNYWMSLTLLRESGGRQKIEWTLPFILFLLGNLLPTECSQNLLRLLRRFFLAIFGPKIRDLFTIRNREQMAIFSVINPVLPFLVGLESGTENHQKARMFIPTEPLRSLEISEKNSTKRRNSFRFAWSQFLGRGCDEALSVIKRACHWKRGEAIQWMRGLGRISTGKAIQRRGPGHSENRRTLKSCCPHPLPENQLLLWARDTWLLCNQKLQANGDFLCDSSGQSWFPLRRFPANGNVRFWCTQVGVN